MLSAQRLRTLPPSARRNALRFWITAAGHLAPPASRLEKLPVRCCRRAPIAALVRWEARCCSARDLLCAARRPRDPRRARGSCTAPRGSQLAVAQAQTCALPGCGGKLTLKRDARGPLDLDALPAR